MNFITDDIAIGNYVEAHNAELLKSAGIRSILGLDGKLHRSQTKELGVERIEVFRFVDGPGNDPAIYRRVIDVLRDLVKQYPPVLVHCHAGRRRSPIIVAGYLMATQSLSSQEAIARVEWRRQIELTAGIEELLDTL